MNVKINDDVEEAKISDKFKLNGFNLGSEMFIGKEDDVNVWRGGNTIYIKNLRIYDRILSNDEVRFLYENRENSLD